jgi:hypothetical protein
MKDMVLKYQVGQVTDENTLSHAVAAAAYTFTLEADSLYRVVSTTLCHIRQAHAATSHDATAAASALLPANTVLYLSTDATNKYLSVIRNAADGTMTVTKMRPGW